MISQLLIYLTPAPSVPCSALGGIGERAKRFVKSLHLESFTGYHLVDELEERVDHIGLLGHLPSLTIGGSCGGSGMGASIVRATPIGFSSQLVVEINDVLSAKSSEVILTASAIGLIPFTLAGLIFLTLISFNSPFISKPLVALSSNKRDPEGESCTPARVDCPLIVIG